MQTLPLVPGTHAITFQSKDLENTVPETELSASLMSFAAQRVQGKVPKVLGRQVHKDKHALGAHPWTLVHPWMQIPQHLLGSNNTPAIAGRQQWSHNNRGPLERAGYFMSNPGGKARRELTDS